MRKTLAAITMLILVFSLGCGSSDTATPIDSNEQDADVGTDAAESFEEEEPDDETESESNKDDDPEVQPRVMHTRVDGNVENPLTCNEICESQSLFCDDDYHTFIGTGGCRASWGPVEDMLRCDDAPTKLKTSYTGNVFELSEFECFCLAPDM